MNCSKDETTYTTEIIDGVKVIHNHTPVWGELPQVKLELVMKIGKLEGEDENYNLFRPYDVLRDSDGNIYVFEMGSSSLKKFDSNGKYLLTIGGRGRGPGEIEMALKADIDTENNIYVADIGTRRFKIFNPDGKNIGIMQMPKMAPMFRMLPEKHILIPLSRDPNDENTLFISDSDGNIVNSFRKKYDFGSELLNQGAQDFHITSDKKGDIYTSLRYGNNIQKYSMAGEHLISFDRPTKVEVNKNPEMKTSNNMNMGSFQPSLVSLSIDIDYLERLWVMSTTRLPDPVTEQDESKNEDMYEFHIFDKDGVFQGIVPVKKNFDTFRIFGDRLYIIEISSEMSVYEYKIVEVNQAK